MYFFDQSSGRPRCKRTRLLDISHGRRNSSINPPLESRKKSTCKKPLSDGECVGGDDAMGAGEVTGKSERKGRRDASLETNSHGAEYDTEKCTDTPPAALQDDLCQEKSLLEDLRRAAPQLLVALEQLLRPCEAREAGFFPRGGLGNVLNYTWSELTQGAVCHTNKRPGQCPVQKLAKPPRKTKGSVASDKPSVDGPHEKTTNAKKKLRKKNNVEETTSVEKLPQGSTSLRVKPNVTNGHKPPVSHLSTTISFSLSSDIFQEQGWLVQSEDLPLDDPQSMALCRWAVDRLQLAQITIKEQGAALAERGFTHPLLLRHYGDARREGAGGGGHSGPGAGGLAFLSLPRQAVDPRGQTGGASPAEAALQNQRRNRLRLSPSGLPCGGLYTNVFGDAPEASLLATFTPFGHGAVTHPVRGTVTSWGQCGGVVCDPDGTVTREWTWSPETRQNKPIVIEERVQLHLSSLPNVAPPTDLDVHLQTEEKFTSNTAWELSKANRENAHDMEAKRKFTTNKPVESWRHRVWRRGLGGGGADPDLSRLQRAVRNILESWLEHYRQATGLSCPVAQRTKDAPVRRSHSLSRRKARSAALPTLNTTETEVEEPDTAQPPGGGAEQPSAPRHTSAPAGRVRPDHAKGSRSPRQGKEEPQHVTETGALRVLSNIRLDPVVILRSPEMRRPPPGPCAPCPALVRAALLGEGGRRLCRCGNRRMPLLADLEYDTFVGGQAARSEQILVVCVTPAAPLPAEDHLDQLYRRRNKHRSMPCTQCHLDSFRLVRYEVPTPDSLPGTHNALLQQRNNVAPGMFLMYVGGKLLFADHIFNGYSCSVRDLLKQIAKTRQDYRQGRSLPPDFHFSPQVGIPRVEGVSTTPQGLRCKSVVGAERCTPQTPSCLRRGSLKPVTGHHQLRIRPHLSP
ncbi:hypothetical protein AAFF_G00061150 [Aldrovandia affinis]|uniref:FAM194 C-terminal domain-containing protein n=1 Tax=Aldrovandia affinis TaxID=143900 RepID=A0AAD7S023_9TELE|nr:hypothetical protein AAFF_G00061150 [Aldrovandia affinis]